MKIVWPVLQRNNLPEGILSLLVGGRDTVGDPLINDPRVPLISATGSVRMGRHVAQAVAARLGPSLLELGGNNAIIVTSSADIELAVRAILFGAVGTAGQRCTTTRRLIVHADIYERIAAELVNVYRQIKIGDPLEEGVLMGPLIDTDATAALQATLAQVKDQGGRVLYGGTVLSGGLYDTVNARDPLHLRSPGRHADCAGGGSSPRCSI